MHNAHLRAEIQTQELQGLRLALNQLNYQGYLFFLFPHPLHTNPTQVRNNLGSFPSVCWLNLHIVLKCSRCFAEKIPRNSKYYSIRNSFKYNLEFLQAIFSKCLLAITMGKKKCLLLLLRICILYIEILLQLRSCSDYLLRVQYCTCIYTTIIHTNYIR